MKDEDLKFQEIETSLTLGGYRRCRYYSDVRYTIVNRSPRICCHKDKGLVAQKNPCECEIEEHEHGVGAGVNTTQTRTRRARVQ
jgi:hypothetical protein